MSSIDNINPDEEDYWLGKGSDLSSQAEDAYYIQHPEKQPKPIDIDFSKEVPF